MVELSKFLCRTRRIMYSKWLLFYCWYYAI